MPAAFVLIAPELVDMPIILVLILAEFAATFVIISEIIAGLPLIIDTFAIASEFCPMLTILAEIASELA